MCEEKDGKQIEELRKQISDYKDKISIKQFNNLLYKDKILQMTDIIYNITEQSELKDLEKHIYDLISAINLKIPPITRDFVANNNNEGNFEKMMGIENQFDCEQFVNICRKNDIVGRF